MSVRARRRVLLGAGVVVLLAAVAAPLASSGLRASLAAGYRAFRDPGLLDRPAPPTQVAALRDGVLALDEAAINAELAREFTGGDHVDLDEPGGLTLASLSLPDLRVPVTRRTMRYVRFFARENAGRTVFVQRYQRAGRYRRIIEEALREGGLPEDLAWVAAIESGFDPRAVSPAGAAGLWQFIPETAALYGLFLSPEVDERRSIHRSTTAAVAHLRDLYERFGRWDLALAGYNLGTEGVLRAMARAAEGRDASERGKPIGFAELAAARVIPEETANYVPQVLAFGIVAANRARFGLDGVEPAAPLETGELAVPPGTRIRTIARAAGVSTAVIRDLNPELLSDRVPSTGGDTLVHLPADRIGHTLAAFPAYLEHETANLVAPSEGTEPVGSAEYQSDRLASTDLATDGGLEVDPLPRRPFQLGRNRLPPFSLPGHEPHVPALARGVLSEIATRDAKLPLMMIGGGAGWHHPEGEPLLGGLSFESPVKGRGLAVDKDLAFLEAARAGVAPDPSSRFRLANGLLAEVRQDPGAPRVAITVRVGDADQSAAAPTLAGVAAASELRSTLTVPARDLDVGIELAGARLRLLLGQAGHEHLVSVRRLASEPRRRALAASPAGRPWLTLGDALFPTGHALEGTVIGARDDVAGARDLYLADALARERHAERASVAIIGDVERPHARRLLEEALGGLRFDGGGPIPPHPREERIGIEDDVPAPRSLYGWIAPAEGTEADAATRVTLEILVGKKLDRLGRSLVEHARVASSVRGRLDLGGRAGVVAIDLTPAAPHDLARCEAVLDAELDTLASEGPTAHELALAKALLRYRLQKEQAAGEAATVAGALRLPSPARVRRALGPGEGEKLVAAVDEVTSAAVKQAVRRVLGRDHRVVVLVEPRSASRVDVGDGLGVSGGGATASAP